ncbi:MAG: pimeloyl-ACP methyl ester esterase BioH [Chromatiales bacterium]
MKLWSQTSGNGPALVLLHGWGMNAAVWQPLLAELESTYSVTRIELPGHGHSAYSASEQSLTDWAEAALEAAPADAIWLGWSLGGLVALQAALLAPQSMRALLLLSATPKFAQADGWPCAMAPAVLQQFADSLSQDSQATLSRFLSLQTKGMADARGMLKQLRAGFAERPVASEAALSTGLQLLRDSDLRDRLYNIDVATSWIFGARDTLTPACVASQVQSLMPAASIHVLDGAAHVPFMSHWPQCFEVLQRLEAQVYA